MLGQLLLIMSSKLAYVGSQSSFVQLPINIYSSKYLCSNGNQHEKKKSLLKSNSTDYVDIIKLDASFELKLNTLHLCVSLK